MRGNDLTGMIHDRPQAVGIMPEPDIRTGLQRGHASIMSEISQIPKPRGVPARALCAFVLAGGITLGLGRAASAQFAFDDAVLSPRVVAWRLADRGFSGMTRPRYDGRVYVVEAVDPAGIPVRLLVDPAVGTIVGRRQLGGSEIYPRREYAPRDDSRQDYARLERPAPGYGWTEEDAGPRRVLRPLPPQDPSGPSPRPARRPGAEAARPDANPSGINPDGNVRSEPQRKVARAVPPSRQPELKPALRTTPEAPAPKVAPVEAAKPDAKPETPAAAIDNAAPADGPNKPAGGGVRAEAAKPGLPDWKDPPAEGKRPVRVIEGATVVPGTSDKDAAQ